MHEYVWHDDQFKFSEMQVSGRDYSYLNTSIDKAGIYGQCVEFLKNGAVPKHIHAHTLFSLQIFGHEGFEEADIAKLMKWSQAIIKLDTAVRENGQISTAFSQNDNQLFTRLVCICREI